MDGATVNSIVAELKSALLPELKSMVDQRLAQAKEVRPTTSGELIFEGTPAEKTAGIANDKDHAHPASQLAEGTCLIGHSFQ